MLTEAAVRRGTFTVFFFRDLGFSEVWIDNQLNIDCWLEEEVMGIAPKQQWTKCAVTS